MTYSLGIRNLLKYFTTRFTSFTCQSASLQSVFVTHCLPQGDYSGFQVTGMIEWGQKSKPKQILRDSNKTKKIPWTKI